MAGSISVSLDDLAEVLAPVGSEMIGNAIYVISETGLWAIYLVLFCWAMRLQIARQKLRNPVNAVILLVTIVLFLISTVLWATEVSHLITMLKTFFLDYPQLPLEDRYPEYKQRYKLDILGNAEEAMFLTNMIIADAVVIWRAWVLTKNTRLHEMVYIPIVILLTSLAFGILAIDCLVQSPGTVTSSIGGDSRTCRWAEPIAWGLSLLTNVGSTTLIGIRAWQYSKFLKRADLSARKSRSLRIITILVESGLVYCLFWLSQVELFFENPVRYKASTFIQMFLNAVGDQVSGLYPTIIIILVNMERSISDVSVAEGSAGTDVSSNRLARAEVSTIEFCTQEGPQSSVARVFVFQNGQTPVPDIERG
ncbi:hypothetical protein V5O48_012490 [Marasmius crinis-equi]|uniref:Uncharacterized protein n=1 Tax=Marasmius crinis-equi TaxID=585013 RepID=A0ABR3F2Z6_9AGAR